MGKEILSRANILGVLRILFLLQTPHLGKFTAVFDQFAEAVALDDVAMQFKSSLNDQITITA